MKKLSLVFGLIAILFMLIGFYFLFNLCTKFEVYALSCFMGGFVSSALFLLTEKWSKKNEIKSNLL